MLKNCRIFNLVENAPSLEIKLPNRIYDFIMSYKVIIFSAVGNGDECNSGIAFAACYYYNIYNTLQYREAIETEI